jgi:hypothetical protein
VNGRGLRTMASTDFGGKPLRVESGHNDPAALRELIAAWC